MKRYAIDVVILPPDHVIELAIMHNRMLLASNPAKIVLGTGRNLPHVSLLMGCLAADDLKPAVSLLHSLAMRQHTLELSITDVQTDKSGVVSFDIERTQQLVTLHEDIARLFGPMLAQDADENDINDPPPIEKSSIEWINRFIPHSCFDNFWPHITLGFGEHAIGFKPFQFRAARLAICHLGNYCTCTSILGEVSLRKE